METNMVSRSRTQLIARVRTSNLPRSDEESSNTGPHPSEHAAYSGTTYLICLSDMVVTQEELHDTFWHFSNNACEHASTYARALTNALSYLFADLRQSVFLQMAGVAVEFANAFG